MKETAMPDIDPATDACTHYEILSSPDNTGTATGKCIHCGRVRRYPPISWSSYYGQWKSAPFDYVERAVLGILAGD